MMCSKTSILLRCIFLLTTFTALALADPHSEERSHCTADGCESQEAVRVVTGLIDDESENGFRLAYSCASPNFVSEEDYPVIFLHGATDTMHSWDGLYHNIPVLTHRKACVYDARNHGDSSRQDTLHVDFLAEDLGRFIDKMKFERVVLVGHSMGGMTAMKYALLNPNKVDRLMVEDISPLGLPEAVTKMVAGIFHLLRSGVAQIPKGADEETARQTMKDYTREVTQLSLPELYIKYNLVQRKDGVWQWKANLDAIQKAMQDAQNAFFVNPQGQYNGKTLFIYGKISEFEIDKQEDEIRKYFPNSEFFGVEGAGHDVHRGHREFQTQLIKFLQ